MKTRASPGLGPGAASHSTIMKEDYGQGDRFGVTAATPVRGLPTAPTQQHHGDGAEHDLEVFERRLPADVFEIVVHLAAHVVHRGIVPLVDLGPARDPGPHALASRVAFDLLSQV